MAVAELLPCVGREDCLGAVRDCYSSAEVGLRLQWEGAGNGKLLDGINPDRLLASPHPVTA